MERWEALRLALGARGCLAARGGLTTRLQGCFASILAPPTAPSPRAGSRGTGKGGALRPLRLGRLDPPPDHPRTAETLPQRLARFADRLARSPTSVCAIGPTQACSKSPPCPSRTACRATRSRRGRRRAAGRIAGDRGGAPEPFLEEMIGEVFQARLHAPIVFAGDEDKAVGVADFSRECFQRSRARRLSDIPCTSGPASADRSPWRRSARPHRRARETLR